MFPSVQTIHPLSERMSRRARREGLAAERAQSSHRIVPPSVARRCKAWKGRVAWMLCSMLQAWDGCPGNTAAKAGRVGQGTYTLAPLASGGTRVSFEYRWLVAPLLDRLTAPLIRAPGDRAGGGFRRAGWDEALDLVARRLAEIQAAHGKDAVAVYGGASLTTEKSYLLGKVEVQALKSVTLSIPRRR